MVRLEKDPHAAFALIIDGKTLTYALEEDLRHQFLNLAVDCASVICCRVSPKQKALVTRLVKEGTGKTTLATGPFTCLSWYEVLQLAPRTVPIHLLDRTSCNARESPSYF